MATNLNFKGFMNEPPAPVEGNGGGRPPVNFPLARQTSIYSLTFDEFQSTLGKDFGSMNMDELLKNIWSAEETQGTASSAITGGGGQDGGNQGGYLQRQGSLTLPRTLSLKTVDEVWKAMSMECNNTGNGATIPQAQRQPTLGEMTLEEFLVRAGVVREETQVAGRANNPGGFLGELAQINGNNASFGVFQQPNRGAGLVQPQVSLQMPNLPLNVNGVRSSQPIAPQLHQQQQQQQQQQQLQQQLIFPKQGAVSYAASMAIPASTQLGSPGIRNGIAGLADPTMNGKLGHGSAMQGGGMGVVGGLGAGLGVGTGSPAALSSDGINSNGDTSSVSPGPYMFNGGIRGRKGSHGVEKVIERRQRRMIKNRESAARSRARKQAYTMELEQELAKLKEENEELRRKQAETMEMQKNQVLEMMDEQRGAKRRCLRRTQTGPW